MVAIPMITITKATTFIRYPYALELAFMRSSALSEQLIMKRLREGVF